MLKICKKMGSDGFVPIRAVFYALFHPTEGTKVVHQVPEGIVGSGTETVFNMDVIRNYIIPKPPLCNKLLATRVGGYKVIGYPVIIENELYSRNSFCFNFCFLFPHNSDTAPYESAILWIGEMFRVLEEQSFVLSRLDNSGIFFKKGTKKLSEELTSMHESFVPGFEKSRRVSLSSIESLIQQIYLDLNNYSECCIPLDNANSVDIKLFPVLPPPMNLKAFQVPCLTVKLNLLVDVNWDPTMVRILPYINGLNSIRKISELADADYLLTKQCIQHLMHYKSVTIIDIFQFSNIYAPTNHISIFLKLQGLAEECQAYVTTDLPTPFSKSMANDDLEAINESPNSFSPYEKDILGLKGKNKKQLYTVVVPSKSTLFYLYCSLTQGQSVKDWYIQHTEQLRNIDVRRFINFGVTRGLIYRVHTYPVLKAITNAMENENPLLEDIDAFVCSKLKLPNKKPAPSREDRLSSSDDKSKLTTGFAGDRGSSINSRIPLRRSLGEASLKTGEKKSNRKVSFSGPASLSPPLMENYSSAFHSSSSSESLENLNSSANLERIHSLQEEIDNYNEITVLVKLIKHFQHLDSICTELDQPRANVETFLDELGSTDYINS